MEIWPEVGSGACEMVTHDGDEELLQLGDTIISSP